MNTDNLILRQTDYPPLVNKDDFLDNADFDSNMINIYDDLVALCLTNGVIAYDISTEYDDAVINYATYDGRLWKFVNAVPSVNVTPGTNEAYWIEVFPTELAHRKNSDTILDEGGANEVTASEIRAFIDAGLTSTTNLSLSEQTDVSVKINSSTGSDVTLLGATETTAGLLISDDKQKLNQLSGINSGDQTLESLGAEATANKVTDFSVIDNITFPTTEAVANKITSDVVDLVDAELTNYASLTYVNEALSAKEDSSNKQTDLTASATKFPTVNAVNTGLGLKENSITAGTTAQYWRGDKSWRTLDKTAVGLGNVANVDTTDATNLTSGTVGTARLGSGTANSTTYLRGDQTWATISAGGLTYFTESQSTSSPNATVNVDSITAIGSTTDVDVAIVPKGAGSFQLAVPDNLTAGGNKRGQYAVDLQMFRANASQVASGSYSVVIGTSNTASGSLSYCLGSTNISSNTFSVSIGYQNTSSGNSSVCIGNTCTANTTSAVSIGTNNTASGSYSVAMGYNNSPSGLYGITIGKDCTATNQSSISIGLRAKATGESAICIGNYFYADSTSSGTNSVLLGFGTASGVYSTALGSNNTANGAYSTAIGYSASTFGVGNRFAMSGNAFTSIGDSQKGIIRLARRTTDATTTILTTDNGATVNTGTQFTLQNQQVVRFKGSITGKQSGSTNIGIWDIDGVIVRGANAGTTTLTISNVTLVTNASGWGTPTLSADTTNGCLKIEVAGLSATNIQWLAILDTVENLYA